MTDKTQENGAGFKALIEIGADFGSKLDGIKKSTDATASIAAIQPLRYPIFNTATTPAVAQSPFLLQIPEQTSPDKGRIWQVISIGIFGADDHTPLTNGTGQSVQATGVSGVAPAANTIITSLSAATLAAAAPLGTVWSVQVTYSLQGTITSADANNMEIVMPIGTVRQLGVFNGIAGNYTMPPILLQPAATQNITVTNPNAASAAAVYAATITATPVTSNPNSQLAQPFAVIYAGPTSGVQAPNALPDVMSEGLNRSANVPIPFFDLIGKDKVWMNPDDILYAWCYNVPALTQLTLVANVDDYPSYAREAADFRPVPRMGLGYPQ